MASDLPAGWVRRMDSKYNREYFYNKLTKESCWKLPLLTAAATVPNSNEDGNVWIKIYSKSRPSQFYFHNRVTGQNTWKNPTKLSEPSSSRRSSIESSISSVLGEQEVTLKSSPSSSLLADHNSLEDLHALQRQLYKERAELTALRLALERERKELEQEKRRFFETNPQYREKVQPLTTTTTTTTTMDDYYTILGVSPDCSSSRELKLAYRKRLVEVHPDKTGGNQDKMIALQTAYGVLSSQWERGIYDWFGLENYQRHVSVLNNFKQLLVSGNLQLGLNGQLVKVWMTPPDFSTLIWGMDRDRVVLELIVNNICEVYVQHGTKYFGIQTNNGSRLVISAL
ncbi:hypothetical protein BASA81_015870 [Batrachochytrium salamandrivorans]|nr:hypothetical protein BASA81_015870 [Batrachochytrium salamandrivorans]